MKPGYILRKLFPGLAIALCLPLHAAEPSQNNPPAHSPVPPVDLSTLKVSDFADDELDLPYYLENFHRVANAVPIEGELRGWITLSVWRGDSNQRTYNARVLESHLSLAYFYCTRRPWNPYFGHPSVRAHLEAMLERWCNMQSPDGKFSEYAEGRWGLAPTAFGTKFMAATLRLLKEGPPIDGALHERVRQAQRNAILITLRDPGFWEHARKYSNQFGNVWAGGLAWLAMNPDDTEVRAGLMKRMKEAATELQSPAGYFYEREGPDWGYSLSTEQSNLHAAWDDARGTEFEPLLRSKVQRFYEWLSWNAVLEPDGSGFVLNRAIETRQRRPWIDVSTDTRLRNFSSVPQAEVVELARAFLSSREQQASETRQLRAELEANWPDLPRMREGDFRGFTPYAFLHRNMAHWLPGEAQRSAACTKLPCADPGRSTHLRVDSRREVHYLYIRRPDYYVAFNAGEQLNADQRYGLGLLWAPGIGALAQTQTGSGDHVWGARRVGQETPYEAGNLIAAIKVNEKPVLPQPGAHDLGEGDVTIRYLLGGSGRKTIHFDNHGIRVMAEHAEDFFESMPLLVRETDALRLEPGRVLLERDGAMALEVLFEAPATAELLDGGGTIGPYRVTTLRLRSAERLSYQVVIAPDRETAR